MIVRAAATPHVGRVMRTLSSILRVAESLDRSHAQAITGLELRDRGDDVLLLVHTATDAELEVWATNRHLQPFEKLLGKPVRLESATISQPAVISTPPRRKQHIKLVSAKAKAARTL